MSLNSYSPATVSISYIPPSRSSFSSTQHQQQVNKYIYLFCLYLFYFIIILYYKFQYSYYHVVHKQYKKKKWNMNITNCIYLSFLDKLFFFINILLGSTLLLKIIILYFFCTSYASFSSSWSKRNFRFW